ncbi:MAG: hypothetical protein P1U68_09885 [Verrucomicrobiales bacterium]|nr:hypothetical protein [Verrucomicrobiales bacterium]
MLLSSSTSTLPVTSLLSLRDAGDHRNWLAEGVSTGVADTIVACVDWAATYPVHKVRKHRRVEAICPMVAPSIADRSFYFAGAFPETREPALTALDEILWSAADRFESEIDASDPRLRCLTLVLPGVRGARLLEATDPSRGIKRDLLRRGILVGEFFPSCPFATTFNPRLFALRSPAPMYVFRTFLESDWRFICQVPAWQTVYRERFGEPPRKLRHLGGRGWRLKQKLKWRVDALKNRLAPAKPEESFFES